MQTRDSIDERIEQLLAKHELDDGTSDVEAAQDEFVQEVRANPDLMNPEEWVSGRFNNYKKQNSFKPKGTDHKQEVFGFAVNPDGIVILHEGSGRSWIQYRKIRRQHIPLRQGLIGKKAAEQMQAFAAEMAHWNEILAKWDASKDTTVEDFLKRTTEEVQ